MIPMARGLLMFVAVGLAAAAPAQQSSTQQYLLEIERQSVIGALNALSKQTGLQITYLQETPTTESVLVGPLRGRYTVDAAMRLLLPSSGFSFVRSSERMIVVTGPKATKSENRAPPDSHARLADRPRIDERKTGVSVDIVRPVATEEIIVTAQRRAERLRDVPIAISALQGEQLDRSIGQGVTAELSRVTGVSALSLPTAGGNTLLSVRGVTATGAIFTGSSPIAYYLDYVPFGFIKSAFVPDSNAYDLERIEVLRGPQGTLYGASAQNGVMRVLTHPAELSEFELKARASVSNTDHGGNNARVDSAINVPILPGVLAARLVLGQQSLSGWIDKPHRADANEGEVYNVRLRIDAQPTDEFSVNVSSWNSRTEYDAASESADGRTNPSLVDDPIDNEFYVSGLKLSYQFDDVSLTSTSGYVDYSSRSYADYALLGIADTMLQTTLESRSFSQEVLLQSTRPGLWRWSVGGMYRDAKDRLYQFRRQYAQPTDYRDTSESVAVFGELTRLLQGGRFELTAGLRYFEDDVSTEEFSRGTTLVVTEDQLIRSEAEFHKLSPRAVLTWHATDGLAVYASYGEGFRSGFPQNGSVIATAPQFAPLKADNLKNYELGTKGDFLAGRLRIEAAAFYIEWQDIQQTLIANVGTPTNPVNVSALVNGETARGPGFELAINVEPVTNVMVGLNISWNDLKIDAPVLSRGLVLFEAGDRLNASPEYVVGGFAEYGLGLDHRTLRFWTSANYTSEMQMHGIAGTRKRSATSDTILLGRVGVTLDDVSEWSATLFVDNVTNEEGAPFRHATIPPVFDPSLRPRTVGVQLEYQF